MAKRRTKGCLAALGIFAALAVGCWAIAGWMLAPVAKGPVRFVRFDRPTPAGEALARLEEEGFLRSGWTMGLYARLCSPLRVVRRGTYRLSPGLEADALLRALAKPIQQMFRFPETNWAARSANLLEKAEICTAEAYKELIGQPQEFQEEVSFPLPKSGTLEGYLYPDTYDLPPLLGARGVVIRQLQNFEAKVLEGKEAPRDLHRDLIVGSMVELEVMRDEERPIVAGVIENRLRLGMPLQIDATILYGLGEWRELTFNDYRNADTPYNTYRNKGLPPGPICSPTVKSIRAAQNPAKHDYLYYVALPEGKHLFSKTYAEHLGNIAKRRAAIAALKK
jgi:UPF0755 protein